VVLTRRQATNWQSGKLSKLEGVAKMALVVLKARPMLLKKLRPSLPLSHGQPQLHNPQVTPNWIGIGVDITPM
jgi:hypothetical protein